MVCNVLTHVYIWYGVGMVCMYTTVCAYYITVIPLGHGTVRGRGRVWRVLVYTFQDNLKVRAYRVGQGKARGVRVGHILRCDVMSHKIVRGVVRCPPGEG